MGTNGVFRYYDQGLEEIALATINEAAYGKLLARALPRVIKTEAQNERMRTGKARYPRPSAHA